MFVALVGLLALSTPAVPPPEPTRPPSIVQIVPLDPIATKPPMSQPTSPLPTGPTFPGLPPLPTGPSRPSLPPLPARPMDAADPQGRQPRSGGKEPIPLETEHFDRHFIPVAGVHDLTFVHPNTKKNVDVTFRLPDAPLKRFEVTRHRISFDYGRRQVSLIFRITGQVDVRYE